MNLLKNCIKKLSVFLIFMPLLANSQILDAQDVGYIYNGRKYIHPLKIVGFTPYFKDIGIVKNGSVVFDDVVYQNIPIAYDICSGELVVTQLKTNVAVVAVKELVDYFVIEKDTVDSIKNEEFGLKPGYYERLYRSSDIQGYAEHIKFLREKSGERTLVRFYEEKVNYLIKMPGDSLFRKFTTYRELLNQDKKLKKEIKKALSISKTDFKENPKRVIIGVLQYIDNHR